MRKLVVEECLQFSVGDVLKRKWGSYNGVIIWDWGFHQASIGFVTNWYVTPPTVTLRYADDAEFNNPVRLRISLQSTQLHHGGNPRWWLTCPLVNGGKPCHRRCGCLYLPDQATYFGCRACHELTYRSAQRAHEEERFWARFTDYRSDLD